MFGLGTPEIILILVIFLLFFGKDKLPDLAKSIGRSFKELKTGFSSSDTPSSTDEGVSDDKKKSI